MKKMQFSDMQIGPYHGNNAIVVMYELDFNGDKIVPGDKIKIKGERGTFTFLHIAHNTLLDKQWIDCMDVDAGTFRAFYIDRLKTVIRPKKKRARIAK